MQRNISPQLVLFGRLVVDHLFSCPNESLLSWWNPLDCLDFFFDGGDGVVGLDAEFYFFAG